MARLHNGLFVSSCCRKARPFAFGKGVLFLEWRRPAVSGKGEGLFRPGRKEGASGVLVSFSPRGIAFLRTTEGKGPPGRNRQAARRTGIRAELLLGDPAWILAAHRKELRSPKGAGRLFAPFQESILIWSRISSRTPKEGAWNCLSPLRRPSREVKRATGCPFPFPSTAISRATWDPVAARGIRGGGSK